jgi:hypothetical protein
MVKRIKASFQGFFGAGFILSEAEGHLSMTIHGIDSRNWQSEYRLGSSASDLASEVEGVVIDLIIKIGHTASCRI